MNTEKAAVHEFWNRASCGEELYLPAADRAGYEAEAEQRYRLEPYIVDFADFKSSAGRSVLEIGVGLGADHHSFAASGATLTGIDLTERAVDHTRRRLDAFQLQSNITVGDAENLPFKNDSFDIVYSWGVLHHSPNTQKAINEAHRVLKPGGTAKIMIYHKWCMIGLMLWIRYALLELRPWRGLSELYSEHLESPGTKAYSVSEAQQLFSDFSKVRISIELSHGDLLSSDAGQRHRGMLLSVARAIWPRWFIRRFLPHAGLFMLIEATK